MKLFKGMSLLSLLEIVELVILSCVFTIKHKYRKFKPKSKPFLV